MVEENTDCCLPTIDGNRVPKTLGNRLPGSPNKSAILLQLDKNSRVGHKTNHTVEDTHQIPKLSHSEGLKAVETTLSYFEQQGASVMDLLFLRRLRDEAAKHSMEETIVRFSLKKVAFEKLAT
ncbi:hypothetical protein TNCV_2888341 [Trichonephila clavipes]|nr:hypothetical protein TNCV_2888341 [Trichonephila clavipes]